MMKGRNLLMKKKRRKRKRGRILKIVKKRKRKKRKMGEDGYMILPGINPNMNLFHNILKMFAVALIVLFATASVAFARELPVGESVYEMQEPTGATTAPLAVYCYRAANWAPGRPIVFVFHGMNRNADDYRASWERFADEDGRFTERSGWTDIFIYPGYRFRAMDALITNFHLPESTLIMLVSAFAGREHVLNAYKVAVQERYRFFSFGDAMLIGDAFEGNQQKSE